MNNKNIVSNNVTILKNTMMLYVRQILALGVGLYTVRVVLDVLGTENYGIYSVVGGVVMFFSFLKESMASATQRFFSYAIGEKDDLKLNQIFSVNLFIYLMIAVVSLILLEVGGFWFVKEQLKLPLERIDAALYLYHFSVLTFFFTIFSTPFTSAIMAHEDMHIYAYLSVLEVVLKLGVVFMLVYVSGDKLMLYAELLFLVSVVLFLIYGWICIKKYKECQILKFYWNKKLFREILGFTGWTLFGQFTTVIRNQAVIILINQFFNPIVVTATAISRNISSQIQIFSTSFNSSLYPPIIKSYASNDKENMFSLINNGSKITFFLMWIFALPFFLEMETILGLWLKDVPEGTILFTRLALIELLINSVSMPIQTAARAPGKMRNYELILGPFQIAIFLISWLMLHLGFEAYVIFVVAIVVNLFMFLVRLIIVNKLVSLPLRKFISEVVFPILEIVLISTVISCFFKYYILGKGLFGSLIVIFISVLSVSISVYFIGLNKDWKDKFKTLVLKKIGILK